MTDLLSQARIDVTGLDPLIAHAKIVEQARTMLSTPDSLLHFTADEIAAVDATWHGITAVLERHAPDPDRPYCTHPRIGERWPCADYRDAAAGLSTGLTAPAAGAHRA